MLWEEKMERLEKYMDKQMDKQTENKMSRNDHIEVLRTMAIGRTEKETIEYAIKQIKQAKKWKRKARIEYQHGYEDGLKDKKMDLPVSWDDAYQRGLEDAWEYARKIMCDEYDAKVFHCGLIKIFRDLTVQEVGRTIHQYEVWKTWEKGYDLSIKDNEEPQTEKTCDNCLFHGHCQYYGKTLTWLLGDKNEQTGEKVCKSWKQDGSKLRKESEEPQIDDKTKSTLKLLKHYCNGNCLDCPFEDIETEFCPLEEYELLDQMRKESHEV